MRAQEKFAATDKVQHSSDHCIVSKNELNLVSVLTNLSHSTDCCAQFRLLSIIDDLLIENLDL